MKTAAELERISDIRRRLASVFLMYVVTAPVADEDVAFLVARLRAALGDGYRYETEHSNDRARIQIFDAIGTRIEDRTLLAHGIPARPNV